MLWVGGDNDGMSILCEVFPGDFDIASSSQQLS